MSYGRRASGDRRLSAGAWVAALLLALALSGGMVLSGCGGEKNPRAAAQARSALGRVIVLGFDGLEPTMVKKWAAEGKLPNFGRLIKEGTFGDLVSVLPPASAPAWVSAVTGVNPGKHGVYGFLASGIPGFVTDAGPGASDPAFTTSAQRGFDAVWDVIGRHGRRSVVINVPMTSPADSINGLMVAGFPHTSEDTPSYYWPPSLASYLAGYRFDTFAETCARGMEDRYIEILDATAVARLDLGLTLFDKERWDLFWLVFTFTDRYQHHFWKYADSSHPMYDPEGGRLYGRQIEEAYRRADLYLGRFLERVKDSDLVIVMSDHGFGPVYHTVNAQNFLFRSLGAVKEVMCTEFFGGTFEILTAGPGAEDKYASLRNRLVQDLRELQDPDRGGSVVDSVYCKEEIYRGPYLDGAPDVICRERAGYLFFTLPRTPDLRLFDAGPTPDRMFSGYHVRHGTVGFYGSNVRSGGTIEARIIDIAPTIYAYLGVPAPAAIDGRVPPVFREEIAGAVVLVRSEADGYRAPRGPGVQDSKRIEKQLRSVGYIQ
jgi:predicted AlkP superfamily phosphohydrolase/phosphomutase